MPTIDVTNTDKGPRGVNTADGLVMLDPGETRSLDVPEAEVRDAPAYLSFGDLPAEPPTAELDGKTVEELQAIAKERGISLPETGTGSNGRVLKSDIVAAIEAGPQQQADELDGMDDETLRATVTALTGTEPPADADRAALLALARG